MAEKKLPFLMKTFPCPACGAPAKHPQFRTRTYSPGKVESDNHVLTYTWHDSQLLQVHPPLYYLYFCTSCFYTASSENYVEPSGVLYGRTGIRTFLAARSGGDGMINLLGRRIDYNTITFESALWMHLLAIYIELLREEAMRDHYTIARLFLRAAWLYREESAAKKAETGAAAVEKPDDATQRAVLESLREFDAVLHQCHEGRDRIVATLNSDAARRENKDSEIYSRALGNVERLLEALHSEAYRIKSTFNLSYISALDTSDRSYDVAFLNEVKTQWIYAPAEETEALRSAVEHFEKAIASDARLND
ncbi:MAG: DUF2225 domain-containing protein, partial [Prosthecobacter sp.]|nr:DUF2225 domain-containing protein [Prosthecobacter sp.]